MPNGELVVELLGELVAELGLDLKIAMVRMKNFRIEGPENDDMYY